MKPTYRRLLDDHGAVAALLADTLYIINANEEVFEKPFLQFDKTVDQFYGITYIKDVAATGPSGGLLRSAKRSRNADATAGSASKKAKTKHDPSSTITE